jgi:hypothetical protein
MCGIRFGGRRVMLAQLDLMKFRAGLVFDPTLARCRGDAYVGLRFSCSVEEGFCRV